MCGRGAGPSLRGGDRRCRGAWVQVWALLGSRGGVGPPADRLLDDRACSQTPACRLGVRLCSAVPESVSRLTAEPFGAREAVSVSTLTGCGTNERDRRPVRPPGRGEPHSAV